MAYALLAWEVLTDDAVVVDQIDAGVLAALAIADFERMCGRVVIFDSNDVDLDVLMASLDDLCRGDDPAGAGGLPVRWVLSNLRDKTFCSGWVAPEYSEARGFDMSGSKNYPAVRGRK